MTRPKTLEQRAAHAYRLLVDDLSGRPEIGEAWVQLVEETPHAVERSIKPAWTSIFERELRAAVDQERERCRALVQTLRERPLLGAEMSNLLADLHFDVRHGIDGAPEATGG